MFCVVIFGFTFMFAALIQLHAQDFVVEQAKTSSEQTTKESSAEGEKAVVVFTGTGTKKMYKKAPVKTEVVSKEKITEKGAVTLFEALNAESGIMADNQCQNCGANTISINGLEGNYTQVLINGYPIVSSLAGVYFFQQFPSQLIERIEVVKGAGSSLYGSGAIAGVVNVITRKPLTNEGAISYKHDFVRGTEAYVKTLTGYVSTVAQDGKAGLSVFGSQMDQDPWDENGDGFSDRAKAILKNFGASGYINLEKDMELTYNIISTYEDRKGGNKLNAEPFDTDIREQAKTNRTDGDFRIEHTVSDLFKYSLFFAFADTKRETYYGPSESPDDATEDNDLALYGKTINPFYIGGLKGTITPAKGHIVSIGYEYFRDRLKDINPSITDRKIDEVYQNHGVFAQYDITWSIINLIVGARADNHSEVNTWQFSPRISAIVNLSDKFRVRGTVATGFKAPQIFDEDFHIDVTLASSDPQNQVIINADDIKVEHSISYTGDVSMDIHKGLYFDIEASVGGFYTEIRDKLEVDYSAPAYSDGTNDYYVRDNVSGVSKVIGGNAELSLVYGKHISFSSGITWIPTAVLPEEQDFANGKTKNMLRVPEITAFATAKVTLRDFTFSITGQWLGNQYVEHDIGDTHGNYLKETGNFVVLNTRLAYTWWHGTTRKMMIFGGIDNITDDFQKDLDKGYTRDAAYVYGPVKPRTYYLGCEMSM